MPATAGKATPSSIDQQPSRADQAVERIVVTPQGFRALLLRLRKAGGYDPKIARVLTRRAPWE